MASIQGRDWGCFTWRQIIIFQLQIKSPPLIIQHFDCLPCLHHQRFPYNLYSMQIKAQRKQSQNSAASPNNYTRYNLCFAYSNSRKHHSDRKTFQQSMRNVSTSFPKTPTSDPNPTTRTSFELTTHYKEKSFFETARIRQSMNILEERGLDEVQYIPHPFPQRKKKSGQHQLIKLLLKYSTHATSQHSASKNPLFSEQNPNLNKGIKGRAKNLSRLNWIKDRYCANRDKEQGVIREGEGFGFANRTFQNASMLRANLHRKKLF